MAPEMLKKMPEIQEYSSEVDLAISYPHVQGSARLITERWKWQQVGHARGRGGLMKWIRDQCAINVTKIRPAADEHGKTNQAEVPCRTPLVIFIFDAFPPPPSTVSSSPP